MQNVDTLFFDLDGTLTDSREGITKSIRYALEQMGHPSPSLEELNRLIGPPLHYYFRDVLGEASVDAALAHYTQRYQTEGKGMIENFVYPDILSVLTKLQQQGKKLFVVTAKPRVPAEMIVKHFGLDRFFGCVYGPEPGHKLKDKSELVARALDCEKLNPNSTVMIGDRKHDILGASKNKVRSIGVCWGFGTKEELQEAGATAIIQKPNDLLGLLGQAA